MNYFKCYINVDGWGVCYSENVCYLWAKDAEEARDIYRKENGYRKNKKGLTIEPAEYNRGIVTSITRNEVVTKTEYDICAVNQLVQYEVLEKVTRYYCPTCKNKVMYKQPCCKYCGTELIYK